MTRIDKVYGHSKVTNELLENYQNNTLHPVWLLCGSEGIGKELVVRNFLINLFPNDTTIAQQDNNINIKYITPNTEYVSEKDSSEETKIKNSISIELIRQSINFLKLKNSSQQYRVIIISPIDALTISAANALLKILEEPPTKSIFFLISHQPWLVLPTIKSRARIIYLRELNFEDFSKLFENINFENNLTLESLFILSNGQPGIAYSILDTNIEKYIISFINLCAKDDGNKYNEALLLGSDIIKSINSEEFSYNIFCELLIHLFTYSLKIYHTKDSKNINNNIKIFIDPLVKIFSKVNEKDTLEIVTNLEKNLNRGKINIGLDKRHILIDSILQTSSISV